MVNINQSPTRSYLQLLVHLPSFKSSLCYDPIELGVLQVQSSTNNLPLIIGVSVGGTVALLLVAVVIGVALLARIWSKKRTTHMINFG